MSIPLGSSTSLSLPGSMLSPSHYSSSLDYSCLWSFFLTETSWGSLAVFGEYWRDRTNRSVCFSRTSYEIDIFLVWFAVVNTFILMRTTPLLLFPVTIPLKMMCKWFWAITCATHVTSIKQFNWIFRISISSSLTMYALWCPPVCCRWFQSPLIRNWLNSIKDFLNSNINMLGSPSSSPSRTSSLSLLVCIPVLFTNRFVCCWVSMKIASRVMPSMILPLFSMS